MPDVLPRMSAILKIIVASEDDVPANCKGCRFLDKYLYSEPFCVNNRQIDFPWGRPDWCPIIVCRRKHLPKKKVEEE